MNQYLKNIQPEVDKTIEHFKQELSSIRTGRANPTMIERVNVIAYGTPTPLMQLASIAVPEARSMRVEPWDKSLTKEIEKALVSADLGVSVSIDGSVVRVTMPLMTEENRRDLIKILKEKLEHTRISIRSIREKTKEDIVSAEKNKQITEDDKFDFQKELDKEVENWNKKLNDMAEAKEKEVMTV
ncbi:ribosome recycling factor [Candidatus Falkowbacteria bacterium RIFOXYD2_FULL_35_9]|uniref:Ribosome-recycling factor n=1 Tax=Candidatus Falkowbacteria bacterium RIFOXYC2_FULL_36_12 TaxID=1798002 RepID=A0A1F5SYF1_9BACT|nr:MAG: ribosome recycling factor [Candidatus Falkowbacteria bacterium RIFOXYB2_FULL_35_7]OGF31748.1 MAG: ribosome recycling factor [Candidatus Falkowbacteria bacterium RIFOXYC2_FULL_36_12]OGF34081.1 MAG: ribosome recycling factor [Candidatus Falkowbacteria bacterium RIFOXYA2_FULL_35_8]OGF48440.1 MAG: ribosome recycling factor [Candidatus Falkowbacteria bacterium RIFOXYD2_FULL_35_9]